MSRQRRLWAWLIVASFYDAAGKELWHTEIFLGQQDSRGWSPETREFDTGPTPPLFALQGKSHVRRVGHR